MDNGLGTTVWERIDKQAQATPERTAIIDGEMEVDYRRLTARARVIASELVTRGVAPGALVGVCMNRTWELAATLLGVWRAGCAYVPLDPKYPRARVHYMLEHAGAAGAIVDDETTAALCAGVPELVQLNAVRADAAEAALAHSAGPVAEDLAYVIYTSGSTGQPKGVAVTHRNVVAMSQSMRHLLKDEELAGVLAATSVCFDPSVLEILGTLSLGGTVVLAQNVLTLPELPALQRVKTCVMVPSAMQALLNAGWSPEGVRCFIFGGEVLKRSLVDQLHALWAQRRENSVADSNPAPRLINVYGPTEDTVFSTAAEISADTQLITIGKPVWGSRSYILDDTLQPVAAGEAGELYLAGDQLARGYLHDDAQTRARFIDRQPSPALPERRLYKTGDLCRWCGDGQIEFLGRVDQQVKVRGFRIELAEIESTLETMPGVAAAAAAVVEAAAGHKTLMGYVVSQDATVTGGAARAYLKERLPGHLVPHNVVRLETLPLLPNGKLDRKALAQPPNELRDSDAHHDESPVAAGENDTAAEQAYRLAGLPQNERRAVMLAIVRSEIASMLGLRDAGQVPLDHTLDELGIDSLTAVELSARLAAIVDRELPASAFMERLTPAAVVDYVLALVAGGATQAPGEKSHGHGSDTLARFQTRMLSSHPAFLAAKAPAWSVTDKGTLVQAFKRLGLRGGGDPYNKVVRTGSGHKGTVADASSNEEREALIWTTNLYLGLNRDPEVIAAARSAVERFGTGMGTSAAASGVTDLHLTFEKNFAELVGKPAGCLFPTGFTANVGVVASLLSSNDVIVMDQLCHASIVDGARLSEAKIRTFQHNNPRDLEAVLKTEASPYRTVLVALESVYSMGEGAAPVAEIVRIAKQYNALVLVDEAHSFGFYGPRGAGLCAALGISDQVDFIMTTLSKALGSLGGVIAAREEHIALLKSSARAFIFQASVSPADIAAALTALRRLSTDDTLRERLWDTTAYMREQFAAAGFDLGSGDGPIVTPHFADKDKLYAIVHSLYKRGVHTAAVTYPIVESGRGRLRFICSAAHTRADVDRTLQALIDAEREVDTARQASARPDSQIEEGDAAGRSSARSPRTEVMAWANAFADYLSDTALPAPGATPHPAPSLAVSVVLPDNDEPVTIVGNAQSFTVQTGEKTDTAFCMLQLTDHQAISSLCASDVQGLLDSIVKGASVLNGQIEPFIWLIGRLSDWQREASRDLSDLSPDVETNAFASGGVV